MARNKLQNVDFQSVEEFLDYLPDDEREIVDFLRELVLDCIPDCEERLAYNVPNYYRLSRICYIWPSAVPWGNVPQYGVVLGFHNGNLLTNDDYYLERERRKQVYTKTFVDTSEIEIDRIKALLFEAVEIDGKLYKDNKNRYR